MLTDTVMDYALRAAVVTGTEDAAMDRLLDEVTPTPPMEREEDPERWDEQS